MYKIGILLATLIIVCFALLEVTVLPVVAIGRAKPELVLAAVVFFALYGGLAMGWKTGLIAGCIKDIFTSSVFGTNILFLWFLGSFFGYNFSKFYRERASTQCLMTFVAVIAYAVFYYVFLTFVKSARGTPVEIGIVQLLGTVGIPIAFYTAAIAPPLFFVLRKLFGIRL
jgi:rod shape-determining protein MreD